MTYKFLKELQKRIYDAIEEAKRDCCDHCNINYEFNDGSYIEIALEEVDSIDVECFPAGSIEKKSSPNVEKAIRDLDTDWDSVEI